MPRYFELGARILCRSTGFGLQVDQPLHYRTVIFQIAGHAHIYHQEKPSDATAAERLLKDLTDHPSITYPPEQHRKLVALIGTMLANSKREF